MRDTLTFSLKNAYEYLERGVDFVIECRPKWNNICASFRDTIHHQRHNLWLINTIYWHTVYLDWGAEKFWIPAMQSVWMTSISDQTILFYSMLFCSIALNYTYMLTTAVYYSYVLNFQVSFKDICIYLHLLPIASIIWAALQTSIDCIIYEIYWNT